MRPVFLAVFVVMGLAIGVEAVSSPAPSGKTGVLNVVLESSVLSVFETPDSFKVAFKGYKALYVAPKNEAMKKALVVGHRLKARIEAPTRRILSLEVVP